MTNNHSQKAILSANGAAPYQPGASPQVFDLNISRAESPNHRAESGMTRAFSPDSFINFFWGDAPGWYGTDLWSSAKAKLNIVGFQSLATSIIAALIVMLTMSACERHITDANLREVKPDMTSKEVESILGQPVKVESPPELKSTEVKTLPVSRYVYEQNGKKVTLTFVGDRLASGGVEGSFDK